MKKRIFYPNPHVQGEITTKEEYRDVLLSFYQEKYPDKDIFVHNMILLVLYLVNAAVGPTIGRLANASILDDNIKKAMIFQRDEVIKICNSNNLSDDFFTLYAFYSGSIEDIKFNLEEKEKIIYSDEIAAITQEITKKIIDDVGAATRSQLTFVEKYTKKPGENKVQWANRVYSSSAENLTTKKDVNLTKSVQFGSDKPTTSSGQTGIVK